MSPETLPYASSVSDFALRYGVSPAAVYRWGKCGLLKVTRIGPRTMRVLREDEQRWLKNQATLTSTPSDPSLDQLARQRAQVKAEIETRLAADDGLNHLGLSRYLFHRLTGMGIYCLRDLEAHPRRRLLPAILDRKNWQELCAALAEKHGLGLDERGEVYPLAEAA